MSEGFQQTSEGTLLFRPVVKPEMTVSAKKKQPCQRDTAQVFRSHGRRVLVQPRVQPGWFKRRRYRSQLRQQDLASLRAELLNTQ